MRRWAQQVTNHLALPQRKNGLEKKKKKKNQTKFLPFKRSAGLTTVAFSRQPSTKAESGKRPLRHVRPSCLDQWFPSYDAWTMGHSSVAFGASLLPQNKYLSN